MTGTVRFRVTAIASLAIAAVLVVGSVALVLAQTALLTQALEDTIAQRADTLEGTLVGRAVPDTLVVSGDEDDVGQLVDADGNVLAATESVAGRGPLVRPPDPAAVEDTFADVDGTGDSRRDHVLSRWVETAQGPVVLSVGSALDDVVEGRRALLRGLSVAVPLAVLVFTVLVWWVVGRTLRPVEDLRREVSSIGPDDGGHRVAVPAGSDEIARLAATLNQMLDRLEQGRLAQERLVADASHELRSPLARMRSELEVELAHPQDARASARQVLADVVRLQALTDDLLLAARLDADRRAGTTYDLPVVDLDDVVAAEVRAVAVRSEVEVDATGVRPAQVRGRADDLGRVVRNLLDNALRHARSRVVVSQGIDGGQVVLVVTDDGPGIPEAEREHVFDRFTRLDPARAGTPDDRGTGLGLAIARALVTALDGTVAVESGPDEGARVVVRLPACDPVARPEIPHEEVLR